MNRKYPFHMFVIGVIMNFIFHYFYLFLPGVLLCLVGSNNKFCLSLGLTLLCLDLLLSIMEQFRIRSAVLSDSDNPEFNELMDAFYSTGDKASIQDVIERDRQLEEEAQRRDQEILQRLVVYRTLRDTVKDGMTLEELIDTFEKMCAISVGDPDNLLFETGTYDFTGEKRFYFNLARQFQFLDDDEYVQLHLDVRYVPSARTFGLPRVHWGDPTDGAFFDIVRNSREFRAVKDLPMEDVEIRIERT